jgi:hypothetical protein
VFFFANIAKLALNVRRRFATVRMRQRGVVTRMARLLGRTRHVARRSSTFEGYPLNVTRR